MDTTNTKKRSEYIFKQIKRHYSYLQDKFEVVGIFLQGSQNYELDVYDEDYRSDVDTKAIVLPSFEDIAYNREPISTTLVLDNNEHIDVKDIRVMFDMFKKQNVNYIEILFTKFKIINKKYKHLMQSLFSAKEEIARYNIYKALDCQAGMSQQKYVALKHPYPTIKDKIDKYGYDPKQLHHILRMNDFVRRYIVCNSYEDCLIPGSKEWLIQIKKGLLNLDEAEKLAKEVNEETHKIVAEYKAQNVNKVEDSVNILLDNVKYSIIKQYISECFNKEDEGKKEVFFQPNNIFFTSDTHFFHANILNFEHRPFKDVDDMNNQMIKLWNDKVTNSDSVYILGDFSFGTVEETNDILKKLNGKKILVLGNHDHFVKNHKFDQSAFLEICNYKEIEYSGKRIVMCHYPFASNDTKKFQLYGHIHSNTEDHIHHCPFNLPDNSYNVGADVNQYTPISIQEILKIMEEKKTNEKRTSMECNTL